jgi:DNA replication and repair protein RecF
LSPGVLDVALALSLEPGWDSASCLADTLARSRRADAESGFARHGPHRADIRFVAGGRDAAMALSRGQTKVLVVLLAVALRDAIGDLSGESPVLLLDDPAAELDAETQRCLLQLIARLSGQTLVSLPALPRDLDRFADARVFHVKRGKIRELLE